MEHFCKGFDHVQFKKSVAFVGRKVVEFSVQIILLLVFQWLEILLNDVLCSFILHGYNCPFSYIKHYNATVLPQ